MGLINDRNGMELTEAEDVKKWQEYTEKIYRKDLHDTDNHNGVITHLPGLREMDFGVFEGRSWREMLEDADYRRWVDGGCEGQCPGGEDRASFTARICSAFDGILAGETETGRKPGCAGEDLPVIIVAHGGTQMALLAERGSPAGDYFSRQTPCGCGWLLEPEAGTGLLKVLKEVSFLRP